ncbi:phosphoribosylglycinamide formyltransferase [Rhodothermaceae bacterium RA]|nr:phosphoribosylglycinamide formyltransferase [Rhodothermaceae bacterium RA]
MRLAVFASGSGTNFQALLQARAEGSLSVDFALCVSNNASAPALERARIHGIPTAVLDPRSYPDEATYTADLAATLEAHGVTFIALAGYLRKIPSAIVRAYHGRMLNIHPSLLPAFGGRGMYGARVHEAVLAYGVRWTGVTVHLVDEAYDTGPIVLQEPVPVYPDDTPERLAARVLRVEHRIYPLAVQLFAERRVTVEGRRVRIDGLPHPSLSAPAPPDP